MKKIILLTLSFALLQCKNEGKTSPKPAEMKTVEKKEVLPPLAPLKLKPGQLPKAIKYSGNFREGISWRDNDGEHIAFLTETGNFINKKISYKFDGSGDAELYAYSYKVSGNKPALEWKIYDFIHDCPVDIVAKFVDATFSVTDLDSDGTAEVWTMYQTVCHGDVSPSDMKIIMYEGRKKYAVRGESKVKIETDDNGKPIYVGGEYKMDEAFMKGAEEFKKYADSLWNKNIITK